MFKNLNTKILASIFLLICIIVVAATFTVAPFNRVALALVNTYTKSTGSQLTPAEWQNLPIDFLARNGGNAMGVNLDLGGHSITNIGGDLDMGTHKIINLTAPTANSDAATKLYVDNSSIKDTGGNQLKIVCGHSTPGYTGWHVYSPWNLHAVDATIDTSGANFKTGTTPNYFAYIQGSYSYLTTGTAVIYSPTDSSFVMFANFLGENNDFRVPALYGGTFITDTLADQTFQWVVYWCGIGIPQ